MNQNKMSISITQLIWIVSFLWVCFFFYGWFAKVPDWWYTVFLIPYLVSIIMLINVPEGEEWLNLVRNVRVLAGWSVFVLFALKILIDYL